jgi:hypothetical protein
MDLSHEKNRRYKYGTKGNTIVGAIALVLVINLIKIQES